MTYSIVSRNTGSPIWHESGLPSLAEQKTAVQIAQLLASDENNQKLFFGVLNEVTQETDSVTPDLGTVTYDHNGRFKLTVSDKQGQSFDYTEVGVVEDENGNKYAAVTDYFDGSITKDTIYKLTPIPTTTAVYEGEFQHGPVLYDNEESDA